MILLLNTGLQNSWITVPVHPARSSLSPLANNSTCMPIIHQMYLFIPFPFLEPQTCVSSSLLDIISTWQLNRHLNFCTSCGKICNYLPQTCTSHRFPVFLTSTTNCIYSNQILDGILDLTFFLIPTFNPSKILWI